MALQSGCFLKRGRTVVAAKTIVVVLTHAPPTPEGFRIKLPMQTREPQLGKLEHLFDAYIYPGCEFDYVDERSALDDFINTEPLTFVRSVLADLDALLDMVDSGALSHARLDQLIFASHCSYYPPGDGKTYYEWLEEVSNHLRAALGLPARKASTKRAEHPAQPPKPPPPPAQPKPRTQVPPLRHAPSSVPQAVPGWAPPRPSPRITVESVLAAGILGALLLGVSGCMVLFGARRSTGPHSPLAGAPFAHAYINPLWVVGFLAGITFRLLSRADESIRVLLIIVTLIGTVIYIGQSVAP